MKKYPLQNQLLFATQIYHQRLLADSSRLNKLIASLHEEAYQIQNMDDQGWLWSKKNYKNGYTSYASQDKLHKMSSSFAETEKYIGKHVECYLKSLDYQCTMKDLIMTEFWVNIMAPNTIHTAHIHPQSVISGTFYVHTPKGCSGIKFEDPRLGFFMNSPQIKAEASLHNQRFYEIFPKAGDIVLFESWQKHEVGLNSSKDPRISVSFNYGWK